MRNARSDFSFSSYEMRDLVKAWLATAIAFAIFFIRGQYSQLSINEFFKLLVTFILTPEFLILVFIAALTAGVGFLLHELMHKYAAHRFGVHSEFRSNDMMLIVMIGLAFFGLIFAAPGAVYFTAQTTRRERGIISLAGPATNMVLALLFFPLTLTGNVLLAAIGAYGFFINAFLGAFNLIPFMGLDGEKVLHWSKLWYFIAVAVAAVLVVAAFVTVGGL